MNAGPHRAAGKGEPMDPFLVPGARVRHPAQPDWGVGQVQSVIGDRVTVNFENQGKVVINAAVIELEVVEEERRD
jgi:Protein of unknown function (DUF3553)